MVDIFGGGDVDKVIIDVIFGRADVRIKGADFPGSGRDEVPGAIAIFGLVKALLIAGVCVIHTVDAFR